MSRDPNLEMLGLIAEALGSLRDRRVFLGGCATGLLLTDPAAPTVRTTRDVDVIVEPASRSAYFRQARMSGEPLRTYLRMEFGKLLANDGFISALPGHLLSDAASQARLPILLRRLSAMSGENERRRNH